MTTINYSIRTLLLLFAISGLFSCGGVAPMNAMPSDFKSAADREKEFLRENADLLKSANEGNAQSQFELGLIYYQGKEIAKNYDNAFSWFSKASQNNHPGSSFYLGIMYMDGNGTDKDCAQSLKYYKKAASANVPDASYNLSVLYSKGECVTKNMETSHYWLLQSAENGFPPAQYYAGLRYFSGKQVKKDFYEAYRWIKLAAEGGYEESFATLGVMYYFGWGTTQNYQASRKWLTISDNNNSEVPMYILGVMYDKGLGGEQNDKIAAYLYKIASEKHLEKDDIFDLKKYLGQVNSNEDYDDMFQTYYERSRNGDKDAKFKVAIMYTLGLGVTKNTWAATKMLSESEYYKVNSAICQYILAVTSLDSYNSGSQKFSYFQDAANSGVPRAQAFVGQMYTTGRIVQKNYSEAFYWLEKASNNGDIYGQYNLAVLYYNGHGVEQDYTKAKLLLRKIAKKRIYDLLSTPID